MTESLAVPHSSGTAPPKLKTPAKACDCHMHIYDADRFPPARQDARAQANAGVEQYRLFQKRIGTSRVVVVQPASNAVDNAVTLDAVAQLGREARGIAVVHPTVTDAELKGFYDGGIRGIRFTQFDPKTAVTTREMILPLAKRVEAFGLHVQIHLRGDQIAASADLLQSLPGTLVFDHMGRVNGAKDPAFAVLRRLIDRGRTWIKLSGAYMFGAAPYSESLPIAQTFLKAAPERMLWGSDWPHPTEGDAHKPDDAALFDLISAWAPDAKSQHRMLVENPVTLYGFGNS